MKQFYRHTSLTSRTKLLYRQNLSNKSNFITELLLIPIDWRKVIKPKESAKKVPLCNLLSKNKKCFVCMKYQKPSGNPLLLLLLASPRLDGSNT